VVGADLLAGRVESGSEDGHGPDDRGRNRGAGSRVPAP
jgi:hypothetical protein